ncbi:helix-turn-helix domain-containing protein [Ohtaekwangia kribbensis]|uniref:Helix-turn-helix domain-containing protein n=1 Tax=Ohtaekwangia kribbensis TaxID=688913 RepID=A0ABW3JXL1_9BACT
MVCNRCKMVVEQELTKLGFKADHVTLGEVTLPESELSKEQLERIDQALLQVGFERIDDRKARLIESVKNKIIERVHHVDSIDRKFNWSDILADELNHDYNSLSNLFSSVEGITIEQYIIRQKIERAKELLFYDELNLSEIALKLGYSSVAHLSSQFKKITGLTPSELKKSRKPQDVRNPLDAVQ